MKGMQPLNYLDVDTMLGTQRVLDQCWLAGRPDRQMEICPESWDAKSRDSWGLLSSSYLFLLCARSLEDFSYALSRGSHIMKEDAVCWFPTGRNAFGPNHLA